MNFLIGINTVLRDTIDPQMETIFQDKRHHAVLESMTVVNTENGLVGCHDAEHEVDENSFLNTGINLKAMSDLGSDDEVLINCDENTLLTHEKCANNVIRACRSHVRLRCRVREPSRVTLKRVIKTLKMRKNANVLLGNLFQLHLFCTALPLTINNGISHLLRNKTASLAIILGKV